MQDREVASRTSRTKMRSAGNQNRNYASMPTQLRNLIKRTLKERGETEWNDLPPIQVHESELKDEHTKTLFARDRHAPHNIVEFSHIAEEFVKLPEISQLHVHIDQDGRMEHIDDEEESRSSQMSGGSQGLQTNIIAMGPLGVTDADLVEVTETEVVGKRLVNKFNFAERDVQTFNLPMKDREQQTDVPARATFSATANAWEIFDAYKAGPMDEDEESEEEEIKPEEEEEEEEEGVKDEDKDEGFHVPSDILAKVSTAVKLVERMVIQNTTDEVSLDFKYFEDEADECKDAGDGTLLPLWKFSYEKAKKLAITGMCWNPKYPDLFAVTYGGFKASKLKKGLLCLFSIKNPTFPDYVYHLEKSAMCVDINPEEPNLIAVGFQDGSVGVFNVGLKTTKPMYYSPAVLKKHFDPVWQVKWQALDLDGMKNFISVSTDGRINCWTLQRAEMLKQTVIKLYCGKHAVENFDGTHLFNYACCTCFAFHPQEADLYLVGTESGEVFFCSKGYSYDVRRTTIHHHMSVNAIQWSPFHPDLYMTGSSDCSVKIWDRTMTEPIFGFELSGPVADVCWAPYSGTTFGAVTEEGKVFIFDLNVNKFEPICQQAVVQKKNKLTHFQFNQMFPIVLCGDDKGNLVSLKLSPNLRKKPKLKKNEVITDVVAFEKDKLMKVLQLVVEPPKETITVD